MPQNLSSVAVVIGALRVNHTITVYKGSQKDMLIFFITMIVVQSFSCLIFYCVFVSFPYGVLGQE